MAPRVFSVLVQLGVLVFAMGCPPEEAIHPCTCRDSDSGGMMFCVKLFNQRQLSPVQATVGYNMFAITITDSSFPYIPHDIFKGTNYEKVRLLNTQVMSLSDTEDAFVGLEDTMTELRATGADYVAGWRWAQIRMLKKLDLIDVNHVHLGAMDDFPSLPKLTALGLIHASISHIGDEAFSLLPSITILELRQNHIDTLKRSMLPRPAHHLSIVNLRDNDLTKLPADFFEEMPSLGLVDLSNNKISVLNENGFFKGLRNVKDIFFQENPVMCDCRLAWIVGWRNPYNFKAKCYGPPRLKGLDVANIQKKDLTCF